MRDKLTKQERSWVTYDWANSVYATVMLAAIFPIYFASMVEGSNGDMWWGIGTSIATGIAAVLAPILGTVADYKGMKKRLLSAFLVLGLVFTGFNAFTDNWKMMLVGYILSYIGFMGANLFYDSLLTDVTTRERMDKVSAWGFGMGYIGGSTIPFLVCIALITFGESIGVGSVLAVKISLIIAVLWWGLFSIPVLKNCKQNYWTERPENHAVADTFRSLWKSIESIATNKGIMLFIIAYFFYIDGVNTVINMATAYGATLGLDTVGMILALLVTQIVAFPCAILFGRLSAKVGTLNMLTGAICMYFVICITGFLMGFGLEEGFLTIGGATAIFWVLAAMVGTVQGGIQALSRSFYGKMVPPSKSNEYFGVFDILGKFAAVMGPAIYAFVKGATGRSSFSILAIIVLFLIGGAVIVFGRKPILKAENEVRGDNRE